MAEANETTPLRCRVAGTQDPRWFDVYAWPLDGSILYHARDVSDQVAAESARFSFVQTLAKTFAHLSTGLAVFDSQQQLILFNPALVELTGLNPEFLTSRPDVPSFFDRLRDLRKVPEPKDYADWRDRMSDLVAKGADAEFSETWNLPDATTFRVTRRPHPEGAFAFLFEDISGEVLQTRRFRAELMLSHSALDALPEAVALFSPLGDLIFTNQGYRTLWRHDPEVSLADHGVLAATKIWAAQCRPTPVWDRVLRTVQDSRQNQLWTSPIQMRDGRKLDCSMRRLPGGNTMVRFFEVPASTLPKVSPDARTMNT